MPRILEAKEEDYPQSMYLIDDITVTGFFSRRSHIPFRGPSSEPYPRPNHTINVLPIQYHKTRQKIVKIGH